MRVLSTTSLSRTFDQIILRACAANPPRPYLGCPAIIAIDGLPSTGKSTLARELAAYINNASSAAYLPMKAVVLKTDDFLRVGQKTLSAEELTALSPEKYLSVKFWYDMEKLERTLLSLRALYLGGEVTVKGLYNRGQFDGEKTYTFSGGAINFIILEGVYSLHPLLCTELFSGGIFLWRPETIRQGQFQYKAQTRSYDPVTSPLFHARITACYLHYLETAIDYFAFPWQLAIYQDDQLELLHRFPEEPASQITQVRADLSQAGWVNV